MCGGERRAWHDLGPVEMRERRGRRGFEAELDDRGEEREDRREKGEASAGDPPHWNWMTSCPAPCT